MAQEIKKKLHILLISFEFPPKTATGGIASYMFHLAALLAKNGCLVTVFSASPAGDKIEVVANEMFTNYLLPADNNESFRHQALQFFQVFIKYSKVDVMESPEVGACAIEIKMAYPQIPLVVKLHTPGVLITKVSRYYEPFIHKLRFVIGAFLRGKVDLGYWAKKDKNKHSDIEFKICELADKILSPSRALKIWANKFWGIPFSKIQVIRNPFSFNDDLFKLQIENRPKIISFIGKLTYLKGIITLTNALPRILSKHPEFVVNIVGRDELFPGTKKSIRDYVAEKLSLFKERVFFTGALSPTEVKRIYSETQILIVPSLWENYPTVILEAMAAGCAVVASKRGGIPEIIRHKQNGLLFNPLKSVYLYSSVIQLIENDELRITLANNGRRELLMQLQDVKFQNEILDTYRNILLA